MYRIVYTAKGKGPGRVHESRKVFNSRASANKHAKARAKNWHHHRIVRG